MHMFVAAGMLAAELAVAAPVPKSPMPGAQEQAVVVPDNWAAVPTVTPSRTKPSAAAPSLAAPSIPAPPSQALIERAARQSIADEKALAVAKSKEAAIPVRYFASSRPQQDKYEKFETAFTEAKVPGCLQPDALKRQPTFIFGGLLAIPFIAVAAIRGKCN